MRPVYADFTVDPPRLGGASIEGAPRFISNHVILGTAESVALEFPDGALVGEQATLGLTALASMAGRSLGHAPLTVALNGHEIVSELIIPGGGIPQDLVYAIPSEWLNAQGPNTLIVVNGADASTFLWLYRVTLEDGSDRGAAGRELAAEAAREAVFTYRTVTRSPDRSQTAEGPTFRLHLDRAEHSLPSQLSWTAADGTHSAISFQSAMEEFSGIFRYPHGEPVTLHGYLTTRAAYDPDDEPAGTRTFEVECSWGDSGWNPGAPLRILLDDGRSDEIDHLAWRDQAGNSASVSFTQNRSGFIGYYQRRGEGPIGMRGTAIGGALPVPVVVAASQEPVEERAGAGNADSGNADSGIAEELIDELTAVGRQVLTIAEDLTGRVVGWLRDRR